MKGPVGDTGDTGATGVKVQTINKRVARQAGCPGMLTENVAAISLTLYRLILKTAVYPLC